MEIGYLWLALSLFLFLMTTGAAIVIAAITYPLVRQTVEERFDEVFSEFRKRQLFSYGLLALLSLVSCSLVSFFPPYSLPENLVVWMSAEFGALVVTTLGSWLVTQKLKRTGFDLSLAQRLGLLHWVITLVWLSGSCLLVWVFLEVVGLI